MKKTIAALALALTSFTAFAQNEKPHFISVNAGASSPLGDFSDTDIYSEKAGFASNGFAYHVEGAFFINPSFGIGAKSGSFYNSIDVATMSDAYEKEFPGTSVSIAAGNFRSYQLMVGPYVHIPLNTVSINFKALGGLLSTTAPELTMVATGPGGSGAGSQPEAGSTAFGFDIGASMRYAFTERVGLSLNADYISGKQTFLYYGIPVNQPVDVIALTAGIALRVR
jgi:hypothetical protein